MNVICANCDRKTSADRSCEHCNGEPALKKRYLLTEVVGQGASGTTYRARDMEEERQVAIKEMGIHGIESFKAHELFEREAGVLCRLEHPGVPTFYDYFEWGEGKALRFYLVMEFVEGETLLEELDRRQYSVDDARDVIWQLGEITRYLHGLSPPVIHRDIKPSNILRRPDGELVLIDFGSVRDVLEADNAGSTIAGTIGYMAPEQLRGEATPASDVYGIGATVLHLLTRCEPTELLGTTNRLEWEEHVALGPALSSVMTRILAVDPVDRLRDGEALIKAVVQSESEVEESSQDWATDDPWGDTPMEASPRSPDDLAEFQHEDADGSEEEEFSSTNFKGSMIALLSGTAVMGIFCGSWLVLAAGDGEVHETRSVVATKSEQSVPHEEGRSDDDLFGYDGFADEIEQELEKLMEEIESGSPTEFEGLDGPQAEEGSALPERLERQAVLSTMQARYPEFRECGDDSLSRPHVTVRFEVAASGDVSSVQIEDDDVSDDVASCIKEVTGETRFPSAQSDSTPIIFPIPVD